ncbi:MAG: zinc ribbon domain-containing protein [Proteobacteria bacterium]|nr:zinc ribbon domain-containing protein [Pseudomonadota bacterium]
MPLYDYQCDSCGPFREWNAMSESTAPMPCPRCGTAAGRLITAPFIANMNPHSRIAHERNEKSAHEPRVVRKTRKDPAKHGESHGHGQHNGHGQHLHVHRGSRPWMIGH